MNPAYSDLIAVILAFVWIIIVGAFAITIALVIVMTAIMAVWLGYKLAKRILLTIQRNSQ